MKLNFITEPIPLPEYFPAENEVEYALVEGTDWMLLAISIILSCSFCMM